MRIEIPTPESWLFTTEYPVLLADVNHTHLAAVSVLPIATEVQMRLFRQLGFPEALSSDRLAGACYIMADAGLVFRSEAYYGDLLQVKVGLGDVGRCSVDLIYQLDNARSGQVVALVKTALVFLDRGTRRPTAVPTAFLERCASVDTQANREVGGA